MSWRCCIAGAPARLPGAPPPHQPLTPPVLPIPLPPCAAHRLYKIALQHGFTRGRRTNQVAAACLYLVCRQDSKPYLLIDFSDALQARAGGAVLFDAVVLQQRGGRSWTACEPGAFAALAGMPVPL